VEVDIDPRVHRRLIGARGASIRRIMDQYKVDIRFPRSDNPNGPVAISGAPENVDDAKDYLLVLEEEYVSRYLKLYSGEQLIELNESKDE
jgi:predicted PilT family ATPase